MLLRAQRPDHGKSETLETSEAKAKAFRQLELLAWDKLKLQSAPDASGFKTLTRLAHSLCDVAQS